MAIVLVAKRESAPFEFGTVAVDEGELEVEDEEDGFEVEDPEVEEDDELPVDEVSEALEVKDEAVSELADEALELPVVAVIEAETAVEPDSVGTTPGAPPVAEKTAL
jgi:hypothetical protein